MLSLAPFYTAKDIAFDPGLLGSWRDAKDTNNVWLFEREGTNAYKVTIRDVGSTNLTEARLFKLGEHLFLDMETPKTGLKEDGKSMFPPAIPAHTLARVNQITPNLRLAFMSDEWLSECLSNNPAAIRHYLYKEEGNDRPLPILTAETAEIQKFVLQHYANTNAWREEGNLQREQ